MKYLTLIILIAAAGGLCSCEKDTFNRSRDAQISFSADTLFFDTVFTSAGSVTRSVKIVNPNNQKLKLSSIKLAGGASSPFKININGAAGNELKDEVINADDSIYVFVQVFVNPDNRDQPFILEDSIGVQYNGNTKWMQLRAYGMNAIFLKNKKIDKDTTWNDFLPVVISGQLTVDTNITLQIKEGTKIFVHATAPIIIHGSLLVEGSVAKPVIFSGDRTDADYKDIPSAWPGIFLSSSSRNNSFKSAIIKNAYQGIIAEGMADNGLPKATLSQSVISNIYDAGILAVGSSILADNSLIANCGSNISILLGGQYSFVNCTIASFGNIYLQHKDPVLQITDYFDQSGAILTSDLRAAFINCILWGDNGSVDNEIKLLKKGNRIFDATFDHCIYKSKDDVSEAEFQDCFLNTPPFFDSIQPSKNIYDFHFKNHPESPAIKNGKPVPFLFDLDGHSRSSPPDIGCYER